MLPVHTKIICTIGPAVDTIEKMVELIHAGMNVARLNFSHGTHEEHKVRIERLKEARKITDRPLAIMADTKGPEIRVGEVKDGSINVETGQHLRIVEHFDGIADHLYVNPFSLF